MGTQRLFTCGSPIGSENLRVGSTPYKQQPRRRIEIADAPPSPGPVIGVDDDPEFKNPKTTAKQFGLRKS
jgi:hypothetical protein